MARRTAAGARTSPEPAIPTSSPTTAILACLCLALCLPEGVEGQVLRGRVVAEDDDRPVPTAHLRLTDADGEVVALAFADSAGRFRLEAPSPGEYELAAEHLGYRRFTSPLLSVKDSAGTYAFDVVLRRQPIPIEGVVVTAERRAEMTEDIRNEIGLHPRSLRFQPLGPGTIREHAEKGRDVVGLLRWANLPSIIVTGTGESLCVRYRARSCLPVYLDGARMTPSIVTLVSLQMLESAVVLTPTESVQYPSGAVLLYSNGFLR